MKKIFALLSSTEKHLEQAKKSLSALSSSDSPEDLTNRVKVLRDDYDTVTIRLLEKKTATLKALLKLYRLVDNSSFVGSPNLLFHIYNNDAVSKGSTKIGDNFGKTIPIEGLVSRENSGTFVELCDALTEAISENLLAVVNEATSDISMVEKLTKKILNIMEPVQKS